MENTKKQSPKPPITQHLQTFNLVVALVAGIVSITVGIYTLKSNFFSSSEYGNLQGIVRDAKLAKPLKLAAVEVMDPEGAVLNTAATDSDGRYYFKNLKAGSYDVKFSAPLHRSGTRAIKVERNLTSTIHIDLIPLDAPGGTQPIPKSPPQWQDAVLQMGEQLLKQWTQKRSPK